MDEIWLRERAREAIRAGHLPERPPDRTWGGPGSGLPCIVCGQPLIREETELELEFLESGPPGAPRVCHLHVGCFNAWQLECRSNLAGRKGLSPEGEGGTIRGDERNPPRGREQT
jgi:hypothetical protein